MMSNNPRQGQVTRNTQETRVAVSLLIDGVGTSKTDTGIGFFDHMLDALARHGLFDLQLACAGDLDVDGHHTVEDVGICLGRAFKQALDTAQGIVRYGNACVPMDEALVQISLDISGRPYYVTDLKILEPKIGDFDSCLVNEFMQAFAFNAGITLHIRQLSGTNGHHIVEAAFKALAQALRQAVAVDSRIQGVLSTKGSLDLDNGVDK